MYSDFDELAGQTFAAVANLMGVNAAWCSSDGKQTAGRVLFKNPTEPTRIGDPGDYEYRVISTIAEYYAGVFPGLKEAAESSHNEFLIIDGRKYLVVDVRTISDGKTYVAQLEAHED